jgi:hypothetical protein
MVTQRPLGQFSLTVVTEQVAKIVTGAQLSIPCQLQIE